MVSIAQHPFLAPPGAVDTDAPAVRPLLVTGVPRSGTTWVGEMLAASRRYHYIYEPFNPSAGVGRDVCNTQFSRYFTYISADNEATYLGPMQDMAESRYHWLRGLAGVRSMRDLRRVWRRGREFANCRRHNVPPLIKDPIALASAEWMSERLDMDVVVVMRHPAACVSSMRRMSWGFDPRRWALSQPALMRDHLEPYRAEIEQLNQIEGFIDRTALGWKLLSQIVVDCQDKHPNWIVVRHEDLSMNPVDGFRGLYRRLGLTFSADAQHKIEDYSAASNPGEIRGRGNAVPLNSRENVNSWRSRLTQEETEKIRRWVEPVSRRFYGDDEW